MGNNSIGDVLTIPNFELLGLESTTERNVEKVVLVMKYNGNIPSTCPDCGAKLYKHGERTINFTDTTLLGKPAEAGISFPRRRCKQCGYMWRPDILEVDEGHYVTNRAFAKIANSSIKQSFEDVGREYGIVPATAKNIFVDFIRDNAAKLRFQTPAFLGLDEIKIKKLGEVTVITDLEHKTLYDMTLGRNQTTLTEYFAEMPNPEKVLWVCTDMYRPFEKSIKDALPNARWVIDHYHLVAYANLAMDAVRKEIQKGLTDKERIATKKGLAYTLRTRQDKMTTEEAAQIKACRNSEKLARLATAFDLKEDFFNIYDNNRTSKDNAQRAFSDWEASIPEDEIYEPFRALAKTVHNFYEQIFNYWDCPIAITNGFTECTNRIIRENSVRGRGSSFEVLRGRTLYRKANLQAIEKSGMLLGPSIPKKGPVFHFEEIKGIEDETVEDENTYYDSFAYDPLLGLIAGQDYDPETGEIFEEGITKLETFEDDLPFI